MSKSDLARLVSGYKENGLEPIPLIQSLGHMEWLFANNQNLDLAINKDVPYTVDPTNPKTQEILSGLWEEAIELFEPSMIHFGLDEIDMRGFDGNGDLGTKVWLHQLPWLLKLAKKHQVAPMLWGDYMLAPGEAPDATHAPDTLDAVVRRRPLTKETWIADWHYAAQPDPEKYTSTKLWESLGMNAVVSSWFRPENIRGTALSAIQDGSGHLQTTWVGYESREQAMLLNPEQFAAFVLAADYSWSGRKELPEELPYDAVNALRRLYFDPSQPLSAQPGNALVGKDSLGKIVAIGNFSVALQSPIQMRTAVSPDRASQLTLLTIPVNQKASNIVVALVTVYPLENTKHLATLEIVYHDGLVDLKKILYGVHVRSIDDRLPTLAAPRSEGISAVGFKVNRDEKIKSLRLVVRNRAAGLRLHGITVI